MNCIFCKIINGEVNSFKLYEDDLIIIVLDAYPECDGHSLVIPKKHYESIMDLPDDLVIHINKIAKAYGKILMEKLGKKSLTLVNNYGDAQVVKHYHLHLLPDSKSNSIMELSEVYKKLI